MLGSKTALGFSFSLPFPHSLTQNNKLKKSFRGAWVAQSAECLTLAQVMILRFVSSSPTSALEPGAYFRFHVSLSLSLLLPHSCSLIIKATRSSRPYKSNRIIRRGKSKGKDHVHVLGVSAWPWASNSQESSSQLSYWAGLSGATSVHVLETKWSLAPLAVLQSYGSK